MNEIINMSWTENQFFLPKLFGRSIILFGKEIVDFPIDHYWYATISMWYKLNGKFVVLTNNGQFSLVFYSIDIKFNLKHVAQNTVHFFANQQNWPIGSIVTLNVKPKWIENERSYSGLRATKNYYFSLFEKTHEVICFMVS